MNPRPNRLLKLASDSDVGIHTPSVEIDRALLRLLSIPLFAMFTAMGAQIAVPTPPFGIPVTLQTLAVLLAAMTLGPKLGGASMLLYLVMGAIGVGVFAEGEAGWAIIVGQTGGYLLGFLLCQPLAHLLIKKRDGSIRGWLALFAAGLAVHMLIFTLGVPWLWWIHNLEGSQSTLTIERAVHYGFVVFIPGMLIKSALAAFIAAWILPSVARKLW
mgnify:CR=1 FL=1